MAAASALGQLIRTLTCLCKHSRMVLQLGAKSAEEKIEWLQQAEEQSTPVSAVLIHATVWMFPYKLMWQCAFSDHRTNNISIGMKFATRMSHQRNQICVMRHSWTMSKSTSAQSQLFLFVCIISDLGAVWVAIYPDASIHYTRPPESMCRDKCHNHDTTSEMPSTLHLLDLTYIYITLYIYIYIQREREGYNIYLPLHIHINLTQLPGYIPRHIRLPSVCPGTQWFLKCHGFRSRTKLTKYYYSRNVL